MSSETEQFLETVPNEALPVDMRQKVIREALRDGIFMSYDIAYDNEERIVETLVQHASVSLAPLMESVIADWSMAWQRYWVTQALGDIGDPRSIPPLLQVLDDQHDYIVEAAIKALRKLEVARVYRSSSDVQLCLTVLNSLGSACRNRYFPLSELLPILTDSLQAPRWEIRRQAVKLLGETGDDAAIPALTQALTDSTHIDDIWDDDGIIAVTAVHALRHIGGETAKQVLLSNADSPHSEVRAHAASALGSLKVDAAIPRLVQLLADDNRYLVSSYELVASTVRESASEALVADFGIRCIPALIQAIQGDPVAQVRWSAIDTIGQLARRADSAREWAALKHRPHDDSSLAEALLGIIPLLKQAFSDTADAFETGNCAAVEAVALLVYLVTPRPGITVNGQLLPISDQPARQRLRFVAADMLIEGLSHSIGLVRGLIAEAFGKLRYVEAVAPLIPLLSDDTPYQLGWYDVANRRVSTTAVAALEKIGTLEAGRAVENWREANRDRAWEQVIDVDLLTTYLREGTPEQQEQAARAPGNAGDARAVEPLIGALSNTHWRVSLAVQSALRDLGEPSIEPLIAALSDYNRWVRNHAIRALEFIGSPRAVAPIIALVTADSDSGIRQIAAYALGNLRDRRAIPALTAVSQNDKDEYVRRAATTSLEQLSEQREST